MKEKFSSIYWPNHIWRKSYIQSQYETRLIEPKTIRAYHISIKTIHAINFVSTWQKVYLYVILPSLKTVGKSYVCNIFYKLI